MQHGTVYEIHAHSVSVRVHNEDVYLHRDLEF